MKILALEFSSPQRSVAVAQFHANGTTLSISEITETGGQATDALGMVLDALREAGLERGQIECLAVGVGPGSYTGIRSAIALAQGWQLGSDARSVGLLPIGSVGCLAEQARAEGVEGSVAVVIDAQRSEFYVAGYEMSASGCRETEPLRLAGREEVEAREAGGALLIGPEVTNWFPRGRKVFPRAAMLARMAAGRTEFLPAERMEPIYLRETSFKKAPPPRALPS